MLLILSTRKESTDDRCGYPFHLGKCGNKFQILVKSGQQAHGFHAFFPVTDVTFSAFPPGLQNISDTISVRDRQCALSGGEQSLRRDIPTILQMLKHLFLQTQLFLASCIFLEDQAALLCIAQNRPPPFSGTQYLYLILLQQCHRSVIHLQPLLRYVLNRFDGSYAIL